MLDYWEEVVGKLFKLETSEGGVFRLLSYVLNVLWERFCELQLHTENNVSNLVQEIPSRISENWKMEKERTCSLDAMSTGAFGS